MRLVHSMRKENNKENKRGYMRVAIISAKGLTLDIKRKREAREV